MPNNLPRTIWYDTDPASGLAGVYLIDQTRLPLVGDVLVCQTLEGVKLAIQTLAVRGAPAIGVAAALGLAVWTANESTDQDASSYLDSLGQAANNLAAARPTAVNLKWAVDKVVAFAGRQPTQDIAALKQAVIDYANSFVADDEAANRAIGAAGAALLDPGTRVLTICNAGSLATAYYGTALGMVYAAYEQGLIDHVWACETRPVNQGARLTAWELMSAGVPCALIADSMAASVMAQGLVDVVITGADCIAANGDTANKIGTLSLAILARHYGIPFYVCAPASTIDAALPDGSGILIEQRDPRELEGFSASGVILPGDGDEARALDLLTSQGPRALALKDGHQMQISRKGGGYAFDAWMRTTPPGVTVYNPAFDVTPGKLITAIVTNEGIKRPPYDFRGSTD